MNTKMMSVLAGSGLAVLVGLGAAQATDLSKLAGTIRIDGSSTVYPLAEAVAEEFAAVAPKVNATVGKSGTGGGFKEFVKGGTDISNASRPIKKEEAKAATDGGVEFIELPVAYDGLSIVVHPHNSWAQEITVDELKKIFSDGSTVKTWKDVRPEYPATAIKIYSPGTDSGTFDYFKEVIVGDKGAIRKDMSVSEDDNVLVNGVAGDEGSIGFFGCAYYFENQDKLRALPVNAGKGAVMPSHDTIEKGTYAPFSRPLFIYVSKKSAAKPEVAAFVEFFLKNAGTLAEEVGYVKLPQGLYDKALANLKSLKAGTQFLDANGEKVHGTLVEIYK